MDKKEKEFENKIFEFEKQGIKLVINGALEIQTLDINKLIQVILEWSSGFPYFLQFQSEFGNKEFMI